MADNLEIIRIPGAPPPTTSAPQSYEGLRGTGTPLVIDNGSTNLRFGFATSSDPTTVTNVVARFRERKQNKPLLLFGDAIDTESGARAQARTPWEGDILLNFDALVSIFPKCISSCSGVPWTQSNGEVTSSVLGQIGERVRLCFHPTRNRHTLNRTSSNHVRKTLFSVAFSIMYDNPSSYIVHMLTDFQ